MLNRSDTYRSCVFNGVCVCVYICLGVCVCVELGLG